MRRGEKLKPGFKKDGFNPDQRKKKRKNHVARKNGSCTRRHLHGIHPSIKQKSMHRPRHACAVF